MDVSTPDRDEFQKDPLFALFSEHRRKVEADDGIGTARPGSPVDVEGLSRQELIGLLNEETRANSAWTVFFHSAIAHSLGLHTSDHKCLDLIWQAESLGTGVTLTPSRLAQMTQLTTGAITGILDRLEHAGYVCREHDPDDRRRIIVRTVPAKVKSDLQPLFDWLMVAFADLCARYSDEELRMMIGFARESQKLLEQAIENLREQQEQT
jgi:DNA-binding MarR family transcriptional regulator